MLAINIESVMSIPADTITSIERTTPFLIINNFAYYIINMEEPRMDDLKQNILRKQVDKEKKSAKDLIKKRKYMDACMHFMALSSIYRKAAYLYPPELAGNLFSMAAGYEGLMVNVRNKERGADLQKLVEIKEGSLTNALFFPEKPSETVEYVGGLQDAKTMIHDLARSERAFLIYGPGGCGKKTLVRAFANSRGIDLYSVQTSYFLSKYFGDSRKVIDTLFDAAMRSPGAVILIEGIDTFTKEKTSFMETKSVMLYLMAKVEEARKFRQFDVFVFASSREPWKMDNDITEHFRGKIYTPVPDPASRAIILKIHLAGSDPTELNMEGLVEKTEGFSGADISDMCYKVLEKMLLEQNSGVQQLNVRTMQQSLSQRALKDEDFTPFIEEAEIASPPEEEYRLWKNEFGG